MCVLVSVGACSEDTCSFIFHLHVGSGDHTQAMSLAHACIYPVSHTASSLLGSWLAFYKWLIKLRVLPCVC